MYFIGLNANFGNKLVLHINMDEPMKFLQRWAHKKKILIDDNIWTCAEFGEVRFEFWMVKGNGKILDVDKAIEERDSFIDIPTRKRHKER